MTATLASTQSRAFLPMFVLPMLGIIAIMMIALSSRNARKIQRQSNGGTDYNGP